MRKQTLLGIAPEVARVEPTAAPAPIATPSATPQPIGKQTLLGIAPVAPNPPAVEPVTSKLGGESVTTTTTTAEEPPADTAEVAAKAPPSVPNVPVPVTTVATDAPTTSDVPKEAALGSREADSVRPPFSSSRDSLPPLQKKRPRWLLPVAAAAVLALGVAGLRSLDRAPTPVPAELAHPLTPSKAAAKAPLASKTNEDGDDDDAPAPGTDGSPDPSPPAPEPLRTLGSAEVAPAAPAPSAAPSTAAAPAPDAPVAATGDAAPAPSALPPASGDVIRINVTSKPPGARLFWKGKEVGTTPFVLELQPGEKHFYELGSPGFITRKVVIDGTKTDINIGLRPDPSAPASVRPRKP